MSYRSRSVRRVARKSKRNFIVSIIIIVVLLYVALTWILPPFINGLGLLTGIFKEHKTIETPVSENTNLAPPVLIIPYEATNSAKIDIAGFATARSEVKIYLDDGLVTSVDVDPSGKFKAQNVSLVLGTNNIYGKTVDDSGKESLPSKTIKLTFDNEKPPLEVSSPTDGQTFSGERKIKVSGKTEPGVTLTVNGERTILDSEGKFNHQISLSDGENNINVEATDNASNLTTIQRNVTFNP